MTEEEKKDKIAAAKARLAQSAVISATVASAAAPAVSNAQQASSQQESSLPPIEQTVSAAPGSAMVTSLEDAENMPAFGSDEWLRASMHADREEHDTAVVEQTKPRITDLDRDFAAAMDADMPEYLEQRQEIIDRLQSPAATNDEWGFVGNWGSFSAENYLTLLNMAKPSDEKSENAPEYEKYIRQKRAELSGENVRNTPTDMRPRHNIDYVSKAAPDRPMEDGALAYFGRSEEPDAENILPAKKIYMMQYNDSQKAQNANQNDHQSQYIQANPIAQMATLYHENTHRKHYLFDASELSQTPVNAAKGDRLTETAARSVEYLAVAAMYSTLREQGIETLQIAQVEPFSDVLDKFTQSGNSSFADYLKEQNISEISVNNERQSIDNLNDIFPDIKQTCNNYNLLKNAKITFGEGDEAETDGLSGFASNTAGKPLTEYLSRFEQSTGTKISSIEIGGEKMSFEELKSRYPDIDGMARDFAKIQQVCTCSMQEQTIDNMLEFYPGLKENIPQSGFDSSDPKQVRNIVKAAADSWHNDPECLAAYNRQSTDAANVAALNFSYYTWNEQLEILQNQDKTYNEAVERMLKNIYIGQNQSVDLTGCRDLLDTMSSADAGKLITESNKTAGNDDRTGIISYAEMKQIDTYFESIGLTTETDKMKYMADFLSNCAARTGTPVDAKLYEIMMSYNSSIGYVDGLAVEISDNQTVARSGIDSYDITGLTINPQMLSSDMNAARRRHDLDVKAATEELSRPVPQTERDTPAAADGTRTISPAVLMQIQLQR